MNIKVFLADDHPVVRNGLRFLLEEQKDLLIVGEASDGREAVEKVRRLQPDIVVMDIAMPELNGIDATQKILESRVSAKIIMLSIYATNEHIVRSLHAGAKGYLLKGSAGQEILEAIYTVNNGKRYLSREIAESVIDNYMYDDKRLHDSPIDSLSGREKEILQLVVEGKTSADIAKIIFISPKTVETYRSRMMRKLGVSNIPSLVKIAVTYGITDINIW
ncbi:MAG: response regulator transcription factor [Pseudomonadota bacterium]